MNATESIEPIVREIVRARASGAVAAQEFPLDTTLGADGLGLDSIAIAEVLLDCQQRFGISVTSLIEGEPLTLGRILAHIGARLEQGTPA